MHLSITLTVKWGKGFSRNLMFLKLLILPTLQHTFQNFLKVWSIPLWRKVGRKFNLYQIRLQMFYSSLYPFSEASNSHSFLNCKATMHINKLISNKVSSNKKCACIFRTLYEEKYKRQMKVQNSSELYTHHHRWVYGNSNACKQHHYAHEHKETTLSLVILR